MKLIRDLCRDAEQGMDELAGVGEATERLCVRACASPYVYSRCTHAFTRAECTCNAQWQATCNVGPGCPRWHCQRSFAVRVKCHSALAQHLQMLQAEGVSVWFI